MHAYIYICVHIKAYIEKTILTEVVWVYACVVNNKKKSEYYKNSIGLCHQDVDDDDEDNFKVYVVMVYIYICI